MGDLYLYMVMIMVIIVRDYLFRILVRNLGFRRILFLIGIVVKSLYLLLIILISLYGLVR